MSNLPSRTVTDFFDNEYSEYAKYVVESRAIPSVVDGFKPTPRKIMCAANNFWKTGSEKQMKLFQLAGIVASTMAYHHGDGSLSSAMVTLAQDFKNSMPLLESLGQFGSLRCPEAGAPRYIGTKLHKNFRLLYKDFDLVDPKVEDGMEIEPKYFLPIVPTVLLNGSSGIAIGFATNIFNRHPKDLIKACLNELDGKRIGELKPWIRGFDGTFEKIDGKETSWLIKGKYEIKNTTTVIVSEIPPSLTHERYEAHLEYLMGRGVIFDYDNMSSDRVNIVVRFQRAKLASLIEQNKLEKELKLEERDTENLTCIGPNDELMEFDTPQQIVKWFVEFRLRFYTLRKQKMISNLTRQLNIISNRALFIKMILEADIKVNNVKKDDVIAQLERKKFDKIDDSFSYLLNMPIYSLTKEKYQDLLNEKKEKETDLEITKKLVETEMYRADLKELEKSIK